MKLEDALILRAKFKPQSFINEAIELYNGVINSPQGDVVEVGSASGGSTIMLIAAAEETKKMVYSIDPYPEEFEGIVSDYTIGITKTLKEDFKQNILNGSYKNIIQYNTHIEDCIEEIPIDLSVVFIDGCHEFSFVKKEVSLLFPRIVTNGFLFIHDVNWNLGQISNTQETGVSNIIEWVKKYNITSTYRIDTMLCLKK